MTASKKPQDELGDLTDKLKDARQAANKQGAGDRDKADLKLLEQEVAAEKLKAARPEPAKAKGTSVDSKLDKALKDSFPGSDPVSSLEPDPVKK